MPQSDSADTADTADTRATSRLLVACIDHPELRADRTALLGASELLWREGLDFDVRLLLFGPPRPSIAEELARKLQGAGRPLRVEVNPSDARVGRILAGARCLAYPVLDEGRGLPVIEALAAGTPVITSDFGSMREFAEGRGGLLVDPTDDHALTAALRALLTDDDLHATLVAEAGTTPARSVADYADELWESLLA